MDPLTAVSLAGTIVQFVDFAGKLISASGELYQDSELKSNLVAAKSAIKIQGLAASAVRDLHDFRSKLQNASTDIHDGLATDEVILQRVAHECDEDAMILVGRLEKLKVPVNASHRGWRSLSHALATIWAKKEIEMMSRKLLEYENQINSQVLHSLGKRLTLLGIQQSDLFNAMAHNNQQMITALVNVQQSQAEDFRDQIRALGQLVDRATIVVTDQENCTRKQREGMVAFKETEQEIRKKVGEDILASFRFPSITERYEEVAEAHRKTYQWLFQPQAEGGHAGQGKRWSSFPDWLRHDSGLYWVNGKAASGKSTLMKYIFMHPETITHLKAWAATSSQQPYPLYSAGFFFWLSGTKEQKSQSGLLRSLLHDILQQNHSLIPVVFPKQWSIRYSAALNLSGTNENPLSNIWLLSSLNLAFKALISQDQLPLKLCLFIDGLDEYECDETEIATLFGEISRSANVKCCVSSRPHLAFQDAFAGQPGLRLEDLTFFDIEQYVKVELAEDSRMRRLSIAEPDEAPRLIKEIVTSANGVFLWVKLVVASLLKGLGNHDQIADLQAQLRALPKKLEDLYVHMILRVDESYQSEASRLYQLIGAAANGREDDWRLVSPLTLLAICLAEEKDQNLVLTAKMQFPTKEDILSRCRITADRITSRCGGLLEIHDGGQPRQQISPNFKVSYLHRTVKDCLEKWETQAILKGRTRGGAADAYNPNVAILKSYILQIKCIREGSRHNFVDPGNCINACVLYARRVEEDTSSANVELMDEFFRIASFWIRRNSSSEQVFRPGSSLFTITVQCGLHRYLRAKLAADNAIGTRKNPGEWSLLDYAFKPGIGLDRFVSAEVVSTLLDFGADPGDALEMTLNHVTMMLHSRPADRSYNEINEDALKPWVDLIEKILRTDVNAKTASLKSMFLSYPRLEQQIDVALESRAQKRKSAKYTEKHKCRQQ